MICRNAVFRRAIIQVIVFIAAALIRRVSGFIDHFNSVNDVIDKPHRQGFGRLEPGFLVHQLIERSLVHLRLLFVDVDDKRLVLVQDVGAFAHLVGVSPAHPRGFVDHVQALIRHDRLVGGTGDDGRGRSALAHEVGRAISFMAFQHIVDHECCIDFSSWRRNKDIDLAGAWVGFQCPVHVALVDAPPFGDFSQHHDVDDTAGCIGDRRRDIDSVSGAVGHDNRLSSEVNRFRFLLSHAQR